MSRTYCLVVLYQFTLKNAYTTLPGLLEYQSVMEESDTQSQYGFVLVCPMFLKNRGNC